jgi:methyl-accepting chemotaxis protein
LKFWRRIDIKSVGFKLFIVLFCTVVLLSALLGLTSYRMARSTIVGEVSSASAEAVAQSADKLDFLFTEYESLTRQFAIDAMLRTDLETVRRDGVGTVDKSQAEDRIRRKLDAVVSSDSRLLGARLVSRNLTEAESYKSVGVNSIRTDESIKTKFGRIVGAAGNPVWFPTQKKGFFSSTNSPSITLGRLLRNLNHPEAEYVLLLEIKAQSLKDVLSNLHIGNAGQVRLLTPDNRIVYAQDSALLESESFIRLGENNSQQKENSFTAKNEQGIDQLVVFKSLATTKWTLMGYAPVSGFLKSAQKLLYVTFAVVLLAAFVAVFIGYYLIRKVGRPLNELCSLMEEGEKGNLKVRTDFKSGDEIGRLGQHFNRMMSEISTLVEQTALSAKEVLDMAEELGKASKVMAETAGEIAEATQEIAKGASSLAVETEKGTLLVDDIGTKMDRVGEINGMMNGSVGRVIDVSEQGTNLMNELVDRTDSTLEMTRRIEENSAKLQESTSLIRSILQPIMEMTSKTNVLSLNASIEASRAGTAGKGFMVIAQEIRKLANQSKESIESASRLTEEIQANIESTTRVVTEASPLFERQMQAVHKASSIFHDVKDEMEQFVGRIENSSASVHKLLESEKQLGESITSVSAVAQETSASTEQVASRSSEQFAVSEKLVNLSDQLEKLAENLKKSLVHFQT